MDTPTITATAKGPNQINLTWAAVTNPGWGYKVEIQSDGDSRYASYTDLTESLINGKNYLDYWVTESNYTDPLSYTSGSEYGPACQFPVFGLKYGTLYNFRVRTYGKTDAGVATYGSYSTVSSATTTTPATIRHVKAGGPYGAGDGTSEANAWGHIYDSISLSAGASTGTLIIVHGGTYTSDSYRPSNSGVSSSRRITLQVDPGETAIISSLQSGTGGVVYLSSRSWIVIDGLKTTAQSTVDPVWQITGGSHNGWINCEMDALTVASRSMYSPHIESSYNLVHGSYFHDVSATQDSGSSIAMYPGNYNTIQYSHLAASGHDQLGLFTTSTYNRVFSTLFDGGRGMGFETVYSGARYNLFEGCIFKDAATSAEYSSTYKPGVELSEGYNTVRRCLIYDNDSHGVEVSSLGGGTANNNLVYNNVFYGNGGCAVNFMNASGQTSNGFYNNIMYLNTGSWDNTPSYVVLRGTYTGTLFDHNLILHSSGSGTAIIFRTSNPNQTVSYADSNWAEFGNNYTSAPTFISATSRDFHLQSTSYGLALGTAVTDATWGNIATGGSLGAFQYYDISGTSDTTAPVVTISTSDPSNITTSSITIAGTASDAVGVTLCKYRIGSAPNDTYGTNLAGTTSWSGTVTGLSPGANTVYVGARDAAGNWGTDSMTVNYNVGVPMSPRNIQLLNSNMRLLHPKR